MTKNLIEGLLEQMNRCRELIKQYEQIGAAGAFAIAAINADIENAERAMGRGELVEIISAYRALESCK